MRSTFDELKNQLTDLKTLVASIAPVTEVLTQHPDSLVRRYATNRQRFDHAAFVVGLYAALEKFIEDLVASFARFEAQRVPYA